MCGIYCQEERAHPTSIAYVDTMLTRMLHRGPHRLDIKTVGRMHMGFVHLRIVDIAMYEAEQPHRSNTGRVTCFNGEVYNYRHLDRAVMSEVELISGMVDEGADLRQFFDGDYAIASYNPSNDQLVLYRDRFGVCPLYYQLYPFVAVSSERRRLYRPIEVPAHGRVIIDVRKRRAKTSVLRLYGATNQFPRPAVAAELLIESVLSRFNHSEVAVGLALSGGLDSSLVAMALRAAGGSFAEYICTGYSLESDDFRYASILADWLGVELRQVLIEPDPPEAARIVEHMDAPEFSAMRWRGALRSWFVAKHARSTVLLTGDGADELLGGYPSHARALARAPAARWRANAKRLSTLKSMQHFNNDRTNKMGMAHSKEYRSPFLASHLSQVLLAQDYQEGKQLLRRVAEYLGMPNAVYNRPEKYSPDELAITALP